MVGILTILPASLAAQETAEPETSVTDTKGTIAPKMGTESPKKGIFEIVPCSLVDNRCEAGWFKFNRDSLDRMLTIAQSEEDCRKAEAHRLDEPDGWDPLTVVLVAGGVTVTVGVAAFLVGYFVGK